MICILLERWTRYIKKEKKEIVNKCKSFKYLITPKALLLNIPGKV